MKMPVKMNSRQKVHENNRRDTLSGAKVTASGCGPDRQWVPASQPRRHFLAGRRAEHTLAAGRATHHALLSRTSQRLRASLRCCSVCGASCYLASQTLMEKEAPSKTIFSWPRGS